MNRREIYRRGVFALRGLVGLALAVPGAAFVLTPLLRRSPEDSGFVPVARLRDLEPGVPKSFPIYKARRDAWTSYPPEPVGTVWLVRGGAGADGPVLALSAECPHLACQVKLAGDRRSFVCPCHDSGFRLDGSRVNKIAPRGMDSLEVAPLDPADPEALVQVKFQRFRTMTEEKAPLG